ncbi:hypothetical protein FACS189443_1850 [Planctomycetales bacterium]|nr:hypothetical protein FACS189443_1850 [Planctomycetales bacterium]
MLPRLLQLKVTLNNTKVWRWFVVKNFFSLFDLHIVLQIVMGWSRSHLAQLQWENKCTQRTTCAIPLGTWGILGKMRTNTV